MTELESNIHPNIVRAKHAKVLSSASSETVAYIVLEYCPGFDLFWYVQSGRVRHQSPLCRILFTQILKGVDHLHSVHGLAHMDLKLENVVVDRNLGLKLIDFGFSEKLDKLPKKFKGTEYYESPEVRHADSKKDAIYMSDKADVFSLGITLFILYFGNYPAENSTCGDELFEQLMSGSVSDAENFFS
jgi:MAP/microtubule affinity-regulating kinase